MRQAKLPIGNPGGAHQWAVILGILIGGAGWTHDEKPPRVSNTELSNPDFRQSLLATNSARQPLNLLLTQSELMAVVRGYEAKTGEVLTAPIDEDEIIVTATGEHAPMRDVSQDVAGGIAAPFWALMHPKDAWRIFVPIPPKGLPRDSERPAPDPR